jgi:4'-phosphopantetheinyl transferase
MYRFVNATWETGPARPRLALGQVDVWRMSGVPAAASGDCRQRARAWLERLLAAYLGVPPERLNLVREHGGKPRLYVHGRVLEFSLSHSASVALVAVSGGPPVGIDVETRRRVTDPLRIARRVFPATSLAALERCSADARLDLFLDHWTRMEARQKALGRGIFEPQVDPASLQSFGFVPGAAQYATLAVATGEIVAPLRFYDEPGPGRAH